MNDIWTKSKWRMKDGRFLPSLKPMAGRPNTFTGFDVLLDGQQLTGNHPGAYYDEVYPLNPELTRGKEKITVKVQGSPDTWAGGVFGVRVMKTKPYAPNLLRAFLYRAS